MSPFDWSRQFLNKIADHHLNSTSRSKEWFRGMMYAVGFIEGYENGEQWYTSDKKLRGEWGQGFQAGCECSRADNARRIEEEKRAFTPETRDEEFNEFYDSIYKKDGVEYGYPPEKTET